MRDVCRRFSPPILTFIGIFLFLEFLIRSSIIPQYLLPAPSDVIKTLHIDGKEYMQASLQTLTAAVLGLLLSCYLGVLLALLFSSSRFMERAFYPYAVFFQTVPIIAIAPLLVIWFGYGLPTVVVSAFIVSIFPVIANTLGGMNSVSAALHDLFRLYSASKYDVLFKLKFPAAFPQIVTGLRIASGLAMIGAIVGEFIAGGGLGGLIDMARTQQRLDKVFAAVLIASFLGMIMLALLHIISRPLLRYWEKF